MYMVPYSTRGYGRSSVASDREPGLDSVPDGFDKAYKLAPFVASIAELSVATGVSEGRLRHWARKRKFNWKVEFCQNPCCGVPLGRLHRKTFKRKYKLCAVCGPQYSRSKGFKQHMDREMGREDGKGTGKGGEDGPIG